jgi:hypothetical protein
VKQEYAALCDLLEKSPTDPAPTESTLAELNADLCARIDKGAADDGDYRRGVIDFLRSVVAAKLAIDNPKLIQR